jgi:hypothetical protein
MYDAMNDPDGRAASDVAAFNAWCDCVRRLLGWTEGTGEDWLALFKSGHTPRDAARTTIYGDTAGD